MNTYLLSWVEDTIRDAIVEFSNLNWVCPTLHLVQLDLIQNQLNKLMEYYLFFFQKTGFLPKDIQLSNHSFILTKQVNELLSDSKDELSISLSLLINQLSPDLKTRIIPIHLQYLKNSNFTLISGIGATDPLGENITFMLHEFSIPRMVIDIIPRDFCYIQRLLEDYSQGIQKNLKEFVVSFNKNYKQFQKDCKIYLEDSFYQFFMKLKMIGVNKDLFFTDKNFKEIAYNNQLGDYLNLYRLFYERYKIKLTEIPRFIQEYKL